ncbi:hypothetical protein J7L13_03560, partial [bacterium]|nr:hypothetical protein [bacterium]
MKKSLSPTALVLISVLLTFAFTSAGFYWYWRSYKERLLANQNTSATTPQPTSPSSTLKQQRTVQKPQEASTPTTDLTINWQTYTLPFSKAKVKIPKWWHLEKASLTGATKGVVSKLYINKDRVPIYYAGPLTKHSMDYEGTITEYNVKLWLQGPSPNEGYVLSREDRQKAINLLKRIYQERALTNSFKKELQNFHLEFFTYSAKYRSLVSYLESEDGEWRGFTMLNAKGQDAGVSPVYSVALYNPKID